MPQHRRNWCWSSLILTAPASVPYSGLIRCSHLGIGILQGIPSGPPPARRSAPGRWAGLAGSHQNIQRRNSSVFYPTDISGSSAICLLCNPKGHALVNEPHQTTSARTVRGSYISNATTGGNHLVKPRRFRNLPIFSLDLAATSWHRDLYLQPRGDSSIQLDIDDVCHRDYQRRATTGGDVVNAYRS